MPTTYTLKQGECIASIAFAFGLLPATIWDDPANAALRELRGDPYVLLPGDVVTVPDKQTKSVACATGKTYRFRRLAVPEKLTFELTELGHLRANVAYAIEVAGTTITGTTDAQGLLESWIPPDAKTATLIIDGTERHELLLSHLDPVTEASGVHARLRNLGYLPSEVDAVITDEQAAAALGNFQEAMQLQRTGVADDETRRLLVRENGS